MSMCLKAFCDNKLVSVAKLTTTSVLQKRSVLSVHYYFVSLFVFPGSDIFKLVLWTPGYLPGQLRCEFVCFCSHATRLSTPQLYNMVSDPGELTPLNITQNVGYQDIVKVMLKAVDEHQASVTPVPDQYAIMNLLWRPWLQPCCNFPYCSCQDPKYATLEP